MTPRRRRWRPITVLLALIVAALAAMWVYVLFIADPKAPNVLEDETWPARAEPICAEVAVQVHDLPPARDFADVEPVEEALRQRADVGEAANELLARQVASLRALPPPAGEHDDLLVDAWLDDWDTFLADRRAHVAEWRSGEDRPFAVTEADTGGPLSNRMDELAKQNDMPSCVVPGDFG